MNWYEQMIVTLGIGFLRQALKKPGQAAVLKHISLDIYQAIKTGYPDDPDFK